MSSFAIEEIHLLESFDFKFQPSIEPKVWARPTWPWRSACAPVPWAFGRHSSLRPG
jgi:hypothetical protein